MFKKGAFLKVWGFLSTVATAVTIYKQVNTLMNLPQEVEGFMSEEEKKKYVNPLYTEKEQVETGV